MEEPFDSFREVTDRLRLGHESAAEAVVHRFERRMAGLAQKKLPARVARKAGVAEVTQSAFKSFFAGLAKGRFAGYDTWEKCWALLAQITCRKCYREVERFQAKGRDVRREVGFSVEMIAPGPTASHDAMLNDLVGVILGELPPRERRVVELALEGHGPGRIAEEVGRSTRFVRRVLDRLRRRLERMRDEST